MCLFLAYLDLSAGAAGAETETRRARWFDIFGMILTSTLTGTTLSSNLHKYRILTRKPYYSIHKGTTDLGRTISSLKIFLPSLSIYI